MSALVKLEKRGQIDRAERVIVISTANGLKFPEFKQRYHEQTLPLTSTWANRPVPLPNDYDTVRRAIDAHRTAEPARALFS